MALFSGLRSVTLVTAARRMNIGPAFNFHSTPARFNVNIFNIQDEDDFKKRVVESKTPVLVDFHASWCGPCRVLGPKIESMVGDQNGDVLLAKVDIDDLADIAMDYQVEAVPTVLGMRNGKQVDKFVGLVDDDKLLSFIRTLTKK